MGKVRQQDAVEITEYAIAKLDIGPGDVLLIKPPDAWSPEDRAYLWRYLNEWVEVQGLNFSVLVAPMECDISVAKDGTNE